MAGRNDARESTVNLTLPRERKLPQGSIIFIIVLLIAIVYGGSYLLAAAHRMAGQPVTPVPDRLAAQAGLSPPPAPASAGPDAAPVDPASPLPNVPSANAPPSNAPSSNASAAASPPPAAPASSPPQSARPTATANIAAAETLPDGQKYGLKNANSRITLRVHKTVQVMVQNPAHTVFISRILQPGDTYRVPNLPGLTLSAADAGAVEVILDESSKGYIGMSGAAADAVSLNPQDLVDRQRQ
jgi:cytoskeleton protein RodZ